MYRRGDEHNLFLDRITHSGDSRPDYDIEAIRFDHDSTTWASWTHRQFIGQMVACSVANSSFRGVLRFLSREARWASRMPGVDPWAQSGDVAPPSPGATVPACNAA